VARRRVVRVEEGGPPLVVDVYDAPRPRGAVLCVHGFASGRRSAKNEALGARLPSLGFTVLALDLQGHGESGGAFESLTIGRSVGDLRRVAALPEFAGATHRVLVGSSFGGLVVSWAAAESPGLCAGVLLIAPAFGYLDRYLPDLPAEERAAWISGRPHVVRTEEREVRLGSGVLEEREARDVARLARALGTPTVIVHGTADDAVPWEASRDFAARASRDDLEVVFLEGADHRLAGHLDDLARVAERFLHRICGDPEHA